MQKSFNPAFQTPPERNPASIDYPLYIQKELKSWESIYLKHEPTNQGRRIMDHWMNRKDYPELTHTTLTRVIRVLIKPGQFELEDGSIAPADKTPREALIYSLSQYTDDPQYIKNFGATGVNVLSWDHFTEGRYQRHQAEFKYDKRGNVTDSVHRGFRYMYYIPYSQKTLREILENHEHDKSLSLACAVASNDIGSEYKDGPRSVFNIQEFIEAESASDLIQANLGDEYGKPYLNRDGSYGGLQRYLADKKKKLEVEQVNHQSTPTRRQYTKPVTS